MSSTDTIYALSSGALPSGVAVIRVSGPAASAIAVDLCGTLPPARQAVLRPIRARNGEVLDHGLVLFFLGPVSFTGEDCLELQTHGGRAVVSAVLDAIGADPRTRHAEAGEFSRRAFLNGKLDLVEIEGLADLIVAETEMQRRLAGEQARGAVSSLYAGWAKRLTHARAMIEAELDFADEEDVPGSVSDHIWADMRALRSELVAHLDGGKAAEIIRDGFQVVIAGAPNAGKSSLLNALAQRDAAIVTDIAGTTRDLVQVDISLAGFAVRLVDTAGLRMTGDRVEQEGIRRAEAAIASAHLVLSLAEDETAFLDLPPTVAPVLKIATKIDRRGDLWDRQAADIGLSTVTGVGLQQLMIRMEAALPQLDAGQSLALPSRRRQRDQLAKAASVLDGALVLRTLDIQAEYLRQAANALGRITGRVDVEDLLDVIFSEFCIGK